MTEINEKEILRRLEIISQIKPTEQAANRAMERVRSALLQEKKEKPNVKFWRIIMKKPITKLAAAAVIIIAAVFGITLLDHSATPAYAIEQTIEAMRQTRIVHMLCRDWNGESIEIWMKLNPHSRLPDHVYLVWPKMDAQILSTPDISYTYTKKLNLFQIENKQLLNFDVQLEKIMEDTAKQLTETKDVGTIQILREYDPNFAKEVIVFSTEDQNNALKITVDPQTKLPLSIHFIRTTNLGNFIRDFDQIVFDEEPPAGIFDFTVPEGALVINRNEVKDDPNCGLISNDLSKQQAAELLAEKYWQGIIRSDFEELKKIWPAANFKKAKELFGQFFSVDDNPPVELVKTRELAEEYGCTVGKILPCIIRHQDGTLKEYKMIVSFRQVNEETFCFVCGFYGISQAIESIE